MSIIQRHSREYEEHLASVRWGLFRGLTIEQRKCCEVCGSTKRLHLHHRHYKTLGHENDEDVVLLCVNHHTKLHEISRTSRKTYDEALELLKKRRVKPKKASRKKKKRWNGFSHQKSSVYHKILTHKERGAILREERAKASELREKRIRTWNT